MQIHIPIYSRLGSKVITEGDKSCVRDAKGDEVWSFDKSAAGDKYIYICGAARSGTLYISKVLHALGYDVGHERAGNDGSVGYHLAVVKPENCLHQVRHPLKQISSMLVHQSWCFMESVIDIPCRDLLGCMTYWLKWNELIEGFAVWRYQLEQIPDVWDELMKRIGHESCSVPDVSTNTNTALEKGFFERKNYRLLDWQDLIDKDKKLAFEIMAKAKEYGYDVPEMDKAEYQNLRERETAEVATV